MFHLVEVLAASPLWIGLCGFGLIIVPIMGISFIHNTELDKTKNNNAVD